MSMIGRRKFLRVLNQRNKKYNSQKTFFNGRTYDSRQEAQDAMWLQSLLKHGKIRALEEQKRIGLHVNGMRICEHVVDFMVTLNDNRTKAVETKGVPTRIWQIKKRLFMALFPGIPYLVNPSERELLR